MSQKQKLPRGKRGTYTRVVSRTTSESLRLVEAEKVNSDSTEPNTYSNLTLHSLQPKPASSFVVTSVVHSPRVDGGTESPEDESRSDDISRVTDLETPSCSEETYSKDVDEELSCFVSAQHFELTQPLVPFEDQMAAKNEEYVSSTDVPSPAPVTTIPSNDIPTDGFVTVSPADETADSVIFTEDVHAVAPVTEPAATPPEKIKHKRIRKPMEEFPVTVKKSEEDVFAAKCNRLIGRFQVIKVESIVPFHRGRWTCHDYLDNSKHAPKDGWVFHNGRFILKDDFEKLNRTDSQELAEQNESSTSFAEGEQQNSIVTQVNQDQVGSTQLQIEQPCMDHGVETSSLVPICQYVGANNATGVQYQATLDTMSISPNIQSSVSQHTIDQNFTTYAGQNVACGWAQSSQYGEGNYSINTQYQTSIDSAPTLTMVQTITQNTVLQRRASDDLQYMSNASEHRAGLPAQYETSMPTQIQSCFTQHTTLQGQLTEQSFHSTDQSAILHRQTSDNQNVANTSTWLPSQYQAAMPQQMQRLDEHRFTDNIGEHLSSAPTYQYIGETHPTKLQYQLSVDSALMPQNNQYATFQTQTSVDQATIDYYQKTFDNAWSSPQYVGENHPPEQYQTSVGSSVQPTIEQSTILQNQIPVQDITSIAGSTYVPTCQYVHESPSKLQYETSFDSTLFAKEIEHSSTSACALTSQFVGDGHSTQMQHQTIDSNRTNVEINQHALQYYAPAQNNANQYVLPATVDSELQFKLPQMTQNINNASQNILETQTTSNEFINTNVQYFGETSNVQQVNYDVNRLTTATSENLQFARPLVPVESSTLQQIPQTNIQANISHSNQGFNIGGQYSATDMDTSIIPQTISHRESYDIQGSIANTPPQTPTSSTDKLLNSVPSQTTQIHTSVMQTPPQTPTNSVISQAGSPLGAFPPVLPQVHPIQSPCMFSNVCYSTPFSFLPVVAYPTLVAADSGVSQSYPNIHYQRQRCNSVPTIKDRETREILEEVKSFLNRSDQNKQASSQEDANEYLVVIKKARSVPSEIHKLETENVIAHRAIERKESKISDVISVDESRESETSTNENVIRNTSTDATKDISVSSISAVDNGTNTDVDDKKNEILSIVQYCLNDICNNVLESIEKKVIEESQKDLSLKLQELFRKATVDKQKLKLSKSLDNETGRFLVGGERKAKRYIPPFSNLKSPGSSSTSSLSDTDCIKSMTFVNSKFEERQESLSDDLISFEEDWFPEDPILKVDTTTSTTDLFTRNLPGSIAIPLDSTNNSESSQMNLGLPDTVFNLDSSMNATTPDTPSLDTETTTTVVAVSSATSPDIQTSEIIPFSPVAGDGTATTTPEVQTKDIVISSSYEEIYRVTSCASSVIDTKIEQAMDMVKTHLMSSMRAEVESLKARIAELMERIHQLEVENDFLKANASPEVLHALRSGVAQQGRVQDASLQNNNFVISSPTQSAAI